MRAVVKPLGQGKAKRWHVYDLDRGSYPISLPGFGNVAQEHPTEEAAQAEADRLNEFHQRT